AACMANDPALRPQRATEIAIRLGMKGVGYGSPRIPSGQESMLAAQPAAAEPSQTPKRIGLVLAMCGVAMFLIGIGAYVVTRSGVGSNVIAPTAIPSATPSVVAETKVTPAASVEATPSAEPSASAAIATLAPSVPIATAAPAATSSVTGSYA